MVSRISTVRRASIRAFGALTLTASLILPGLSFAAEPAPSVDVSKLAIPADQQATTTLGNRASKLQGNVDLVVRLQGKSVLQALGRDLKRGNVRPTAAETQAELARIKAEQDAIVAKIATLGGKEVARLSKTINAVVVSADASKIKDIAKLAGVAGVRQAENYERNLSETVPYIGAAAAQAAGIDGTGVTVAVLDSGVDYTHKNLGGAGTLEAYEAAYGTGPSDPKNTTTDGLFPTAKVVGGFDFVGEAWPNGARTEDPDPIDLEGHGTHVADIIAGASADGTHKGVAPGAKILAVKVCSAVSSSCNGVALLLGVEFAVDPNNDGDLSDAVDVINMSLGSSYGRPEDDLSFASANAVKAGVVVVASAGNSADRPFIVGSPSSTPEVISVAQTQVPSATAFALRINSPAAIASLARNTATLDFAPIGAGFTGDVVFVGRGCNGDPILANPTGKVALVDRGACAVSQKVANLTAAGASGILLGLVASGDAVSFSNGGECPVPADSSVCKPTLVIIQATSSAIKAQLNGGNVVNVSVSPADSTALIGSMVGSSSRGPNYANEIKPDIGAPGASISAIAGTGDGTEAFGGTSGAAPMVSGAAALLVQKYPSRIPAEIKSVLMNTAETNIQTNPANAPGVLAPITRIGGGEVRVNKALNSQTAAWDQKELTGSLSFGYHTLFQTTGFTKRVLVRNYSNTARTYRIIPTYRYADDQISDAVSVNVPWSIRVPANSSRTFVVQMWVRPNQLPEWTLDGGASGGNGALLQTVEYDGYLNIVNTADPNDTVSMPWHVLPRRSSNVEYVNQTVNMKIFPAMTFGNWNGQVDGLGEVFALTGRSNKVAASALPNDGDNFAMIDLRAVGVRQVGSSAVQFLVNTFGTRPHPNYPAEFDVYVDSNNDGTDDYVIYNAELNGFAATGQNVVFVGNLATGRATAFFFTFADLNSSSVILTAPLSALGLTPTSQFRFSVYAFDNYFTGALTDAIENMTHTLSTPKFSAPEFVEVPRLEINQVPITVVPGGAAASPSQTGFLVFFSNQVVQKETGIVIVRQ